MTKKKSNWNSVLAIAIPILTVAASGVTASYTIGTKIGVLNQTIKDLTDQKVHDAEEFKAIWVKFNQLGK